MFNLELSISDWRRQMLAAGIKSPVPLEELESHLRDEIEEQVRAGLNGEPAFRAAAQKIGSAPAVKIEFEKVEAAREKRLWRERLQRAARIVSTLGISLVSFGMIGQILSINGSLTPGQRTWSLIGLGVFAMLIPAGKFGCRVFPMLHSQRIRNAICPSDFWIVGFLATDILQRHNLTAGQTSVAFVWFWFVPMGPWIGWYWATESAARKKDRIVLETKIGVPVRIK